MAGPLKGRAALKSMSAPLKRRGGKGVAGKIATAPEALDPGKALKAAKTTKAPKALDPGKGLKAPKAAPRAKGPKPPSTGAILKGRLSGRTDPALEAASVSVDFDYKLALYDIEGSLAHAEMLRAASIIDEEDADGIKRGLEALRAAIVGGGFKWDPALEDVHMNIERALTDRIGAAGAKLHTARSRNDQVALDEALYLRDAAAEADKGLRRLREALVKKAFDAADNPMPGYTHLQRAQPVLVGHHLMAYYHMLSRDRARLAGLRGRLDTLPLGSGALSGTGLPIRPEVVAKRLGFSRLAPNSLDAVSSRDLVLEYLSFAAILMTHLSRLSEDVILWCSKEFSFASLPDSLATTSSMMPQKKNPDGAELIRGKAGRTAGNLVSLLVTVKGLPLSYNRDLQEDKEPLFDTCETLSKVLPLAARIIEEIEFDYEAARLAADDPYVAATDLADHLVLQGVPFRLAHEQVGRLVAKACSLGKPLRELSDNDVWEFCPMAASRFAQTLVLEKLLEARSTTPGGTAPEAVSAQIALAFGELSAETPLEADR
jgi:argininosuccinate lyase